MRAARVGKSARAGRGREGREGRESREGGRESREGRERTRPERGRRRELPVRTAPAPAELELTGMHLDAPVEEFGELADLPDLADYPELQSREEALPAGTEAGPEFEDGDAEGRPGSRRRRRGRRGGRGRRREEPAPAEAGVSGAIVGAAEDTAEPTVLGNPYDTEGGEEEEAFVPAYPRGRTAGRESGRQGRAEHRRSGERIRDERVRRTRAVRISGAMSRRTSSSAASAFATSAFARSPGKRITTTEESFTPGPIGRDEPPRGRDRGRRSSGMPAAGAVRAGKEDPRRHASRGGGEAARELRDLRAVRSGRGGRRSLPARRPFAIAGGNRRIAPDRRHRGRARLHQPAEKRGRAPGKPTEHGSHPAPAPLALARGPGTQAGTYARARERPRSLRGDRGAHHRVDQSAHGGPRSPSAARGPRAHQRRGPDRSARRARARSTPSPAPSSWWWSACGAAAASSTSAPAPPAGSACSMPPNVPPPSAPIPPSSGASWRAARRRSCARSKAPKMMETPPGRRSSPKGSPRRTSWWGSRPAAARRSWSPRSATPGRWGRGRCS